MYKISPDEKVFYILKREHSVLLHEIQDCTEKNYLSWEEHDLLFKYLNIFAERLHRKLDGVYQYHQKKGPEKIT